MSNSGNPDILDKFKVGPGVVFQAKLIGVTPINDGGGENVCAIAMKKLKEESKQRKQHKPRVFFIVDCEGVKIRRNDDNCMGEILHHHFAPHISSVWRDRNDDRAFGYVTVLPVGEKGMAKHFVAIKTQQSAVLAADTLKELFVGLMQQKKRYSVVPETSRNESGENRKGQTRTSLNMPALERNL